MGRNNGCIWAKLVAFRQNRLSLGEIGLYFVKIYTDRPDLFFFKHCKTGYISANVPKWNRFLKIVKQSFFGQNKLRTEF